MLLSHFVQAKLHFFKIQTKKAWRLRALYAKKIPKKLTTELISWEIKNILLTKLLQVLGDTMARCYIKFETMQKLSELQKETSLQELVISTWRHI